MGNTANYAKQVREIWDVISLEIVIYFYFSLWGPINVVAFNTVILLLAMAHLKAVLTDPGTVPLPQTRLDFSDIHSSEMGTSSHLYL